MWLQVLNTHVRTAHIKSCTFTCVLPYSYCTCIGTSWWWMRGASTASLMFWLNQINRAMTYIWSTIKKKNRQRNFEGCKTVGAVAVRIGHIPLIHRLVFSFHRQLQRSSERCHSHRLQWSVPLKIADAFLVQYNFRAMPLNQIDSSVPAPRSHSSPY